MKRLSDKSSTSKGQSKLQNKGRRRLTSLTCTNKAVIRLIKDHREMCKMSQRELARIMGLNEGYFCLVEKDRASVPLKRVGELCIELSIRRDDYLKAYLEDRARDFKRDVGYGK